MSKNKIFLLAADCCLACLLLVPYHAKAVETDCNIAESAIDSASALRGLKIKRAVPCRLENKKQVEAYLRATINTKIPAEKLRNEERVYKLIGIIPDDYSYVDGLIKLYTEQLGGYYDPEKDYYAMASWMPSAVQMPIAVHELTHALQDQHFKLDKMLDHKTATSDQLMARSALVEGDATAVMIDYSRDLMGQGSLANEASISMFMIQNISGAMFSSSLQKAPPALQVMLIFPYISGLNFAHALLKEGGYSVIDAAFGRLPETTEEILHPQIYISAEKSYRKVSETSPPDWVKLRSKKAVYTDSLGEFITSTLLGTYLPLTQASSAAAGWAGDLVALYESSKTSKGVVVWTTLWDSEADAKEFYQAVVDMFKKRFSSEPVFGADTATFFGKDVGKSVVERDGTLIRIVVGG